MDMHINPKTRDYDGKQITTLANAVYLRLMTPLGAWWADKTLGSRLHELEREKDLTRVYKLAQQYAEIALRPLIKDGRAKQIEVVASRLDKGICLLVINVTTRGGEKFTLEYPIKVL